MQTPKHAPPTPRPFGCPRGGAGLNRDQIKVVRLYHGELVTTHEILTALREVIFDHTLPRTLF